MSHEILGEFFSEGREKNLESVLRESEIFLMEYEKDVTPQAGKYLRGDQRWRKGFGPQDFKMVERLIEAEAQKPEVTASREAVDAIKEWLDPRNI